jgi:hypothetical protein
MNVDHKDNNKLNNKLNNLQLLTNQKNIRKALKHKDSTSGFAGVTFNKEKNKYDTRIMDNYKIINLGRFNTPEEAYEVYLAAKIKYHGAESIAPLIN